MNELKTFNNPEFGELRELTIDGEAWFVGRDIALALGYSKPTDAVNRHVDSEDTLKRGILDSNGKTQQTTLINESGMYTLIIMSQIPSAKKFKRWVTKEVLPSVIKTGSYNINPPAITQSELILQIAQQGVDFEKRINCIEEKQQEFQNKLETTLQVFTNPNPDHWRDDMEDAINSLVVTYSLNPIVFRGHLYEDVEKSNVRLESRLSRLRTRMKRQGYVYRERMAITKLDVISKDTQLRFIFEGVIKKYQAMYGMQASRQLAM